MERNIKQKFKEQSKSQSTTTAPSTSTSTTLATNESRLTIEKSTTNTKIGRLDKFLKAIDKNVPTGKQKAQTISEEISLYASLCRKYRSVDAIQFWKRHGEQVPLLKAMAQQYLSTPSTSVSSESAFSLSAYIARKERARLTPDNLSYTVFLKDKLRSPSK